MSKYDSLELIISSTERQLEAYLAELARLKEEEKAKFITAEFVQARDDQSENWILGGYIDPLVNHEYRHRVAVAGLGGTAFKFCRLPKDVPGILIRHDGSDVCPVSDGKAKVLVIENQDKFSTKAIGVSLAENIFWMRIKFYIILPEYVK